jgi:hypothetical protein
MSSKDFYVFSPYDSRYSEKLTTEEYWVCTKCFDLTSLGKDYQHCKCEPEPDIARPKVDCPSGFLLCALCARGIAGGLSRWSWLVCSECKEIAVGRTINGSNIPIGRHSIMNGGLWPLTVESDSEREGQVQEMLKFIDLQNELLIFGKFRAKNLFESDQLLEGERHISVFQWKHSFPASEELSRAALAAFRKHVRDKLKVLS